MDRPAGEGVEKIHKVIGQLLSGDPLWLMAEKTLFEIDIRIAKLRELIVENKASFETMRELDELIAQRMALIQAGTEKRQVCRS